MLFIYFLHSFHYLVIFIYLFTHTFSLELCYLLENPLKHEKKFKKVTANNNLIIFIKLFIYLPFFNEIVLLTRKLSKTIKKVTVIEE